MLMFQKRSAEERQSFNTSIAPKCLEVKGLSLTKERLYSISAAVNKAILEEDKRFTAMRSVAVSDAFSTRVTI